MWALSRLRNSETPYFNFYFKGMFNSGLQALEGRNLFYSSMNPQWYNAGNIIDAQIVFEGCRCLCPKSQHQGRWHNQAEPCIYEPLVKGSVTEFSLPGCLLLEEKKSFFFLFFFPCKNILNIFANTSQNVLLEKFLSNFQVDISMTVNTESPNSNKWLTRILKIRRK